MEATANEKLDVIFEFIQAIANLDDPELLLDDVLELLKKYGFDWSAVKIIDPVSEDIIIRFASGLSLEERKRGRYKLGEGITGTVVQSGQPIVIQKIGTDSRFLNRTGMPDIHDASFYCFPIRVEQRVIGALSALSHNSNDEEHESNCILLKRLTPVVSQALRIREKIERERLTLKQENQTLRSELSEKRRLNNIVGNSSKMQAIYDQIRMVTNSNATVLIRGENGTGKELVADAIHYSSFRANKPFIKINCAALPENLLESELFGHEKGSFTGAMQTKKGRFELAEGGSIFLDEIGEINQTVQVKLLRFLQSREFERVGGVHTIQSNVRIVAATNRNLEEEIKKGNFREDLYYRLNVFPLYIPPLRERKTDLTLLADFFLDKYTKENDKDIRRISTPAIDMLLSYHWPGNVRELENCMERAVLVCQSDTIRAQDLPPSLQTSTSTSAPQPQNLGSWTMPQAVENLEKEMIIEALKNNSGHQGKAASAIGITERQMGYKMRKYNVSREYIHS
jgi:Nif-specific regulatory protein